MSTRDPNAPLVTEGLLPVKLLQHYILGWFEQISPTLRETVLSEQKYCGLEPGIGYHVEAKAIDDVAWIAPNRKIHLKEPYLQFLWCVCYALIVLYEEGFQKPVRNGEKELWLDEADPLIAKALALLDAAMKLRSGFDTTWFAELPQPTNPNHETDERVDKASNVFVAASAFILTHEVAHQYFDHIAVDSSGDESKREEFAADSYALDFLKQGLGIDRDHDQINSLGVIAVMTTFILLCPTFEGGDDHPDLDVRYLHALASLGLDAAEDMWVMACISLRLYSRYHDASVRVPRGEDLRSYRDLFYVILVQIVRQKHPGYSA